MEKIQSAFLQNLCLVIKIARKRKKKLSHCAHNSLKMYEWIVTKFGIDNKQTCVFKMIYF